MNAKRMLNRLSNCGVPLEINIYPGYYFMTELDVIIGEPLEPDSDYFTYLNTHVCMSILNSLGEPLTTVHRNKGEFIYYLWKIE